MVHIIYVIIAYIKLYVMLYTHTFPHFNPHKKPGINIIISIFEEKKEVLITLEVNYFECQIT